MQQSDQVLPATFHETLRLSQREQHATRGQRADLRLGRAKFLKQIVRSVADCLSVLQQELHATPEQTADVKLDSQEFLSRIACNLADWLSVLQRELHATPEQRADLKLARREFLSQIARNISERQQLLQMLQDSMPPGSDYPMTATKSVAHPALLYSISWFCCSLSIFSLLVLLHYMMTSNLCVWQHNSAVPVVVHCSWQGLPLDCHQVRCNSKLQLSLMSSAQQSGLQSSS